MGEQRKQLEQAIQRWRAELINLTRQNRLLYFRHWPVASLEISIPNSETIHQYLSAATRAPVTFYEPPPPPATGTSSTDAPPPVPQPRPREIVTTKSVARDLTSSLKTLERKALDAFNDQGIWTLYLGLGFLHWTDPSDGKPAESPLLLFPVRFNRSSTADVYRLWPSEEDAVINPALVVKLQRDLGIELPTLDDLEDQTPGQVMAAVARCVEGQSAWEVRDRAVLALFSFTKEVMYRDLLDHEEQVLSHPLVESLVLGSAATSAAALAFEPPAMELLDSIAPVEELHNVLDADSTQRRCIVAARDGKSFVMDGPPGTGKSQTITNIIAELIAQGRNVLFVSEKAAALDVVKSRLQDRGLDGFVLELHSHNVARRGVAQALDRAFRTRPNVDGTNSVNLSKFKRRQQQLADYVAAIDTPSDGLGLSLNDVAGRLAALVRAAPAPAPGFDPTQLTIDLFTEIGDHAATLGRAWGPVARADEFLWRDLTAPVSGAERIKELQQLASRALDLTPELGEMQREIAASAGLLDWSDPGRADQLTAVLRHLIHRPVIPELWLTGQSTKQLRVQVRKEAEVQARLLECLGELSAALGERWRELRPDLSSQLDGAVRSLLDGPFHYRLDPAARRDHIRQVAQAMTEAGRLQEAVSGPFEVLRSAFKIKDLSCTLERADELARLALLANEPDRPEAAWLDPYAQAGLQQAEALLSRAAADSRSQRDALKEVYRPEVVTLDLRGLRTRFRDVHKGLRKISGSYRADKKTLAAATLAGRVTDQVLERLDAAIAYQDSLASLEQVERSHAEALGSHYYAGIDTDFERVERALQVAANAVRLARNEIDPAALRAQLARGVATDPHLREAASAITAALSRWQVDHGVHIGELATRIARMPVEQLSAGLAPFDDALHAIDDGLTLAASLGMPNPSLAETSAIARPRLDVDGAEREAATHGPRLREEFGPLYRGFDTDWSAVNKAIDWTEQLLTITNGPVGASTAARLMTFTRNPGEFEIAVRSWRSAVDNLLAVFEASPAEAYRAEVMASYLGAGRLLGALASTAGDAAEWTVFRRERAWLDQQGLGTALDEIEARREPAHSVAPSIDRAVLGSWAQHQLATDPRFEPCRSIERDDAVRVFRQLDAELLDTAAARAITAAASNRPTHVIGAINVITKEANKKSRHRPIRELLRETGETAQRLKPVFMMSPLAVSTYLPSNLVFDAVIFDEASQVRPSDAVNCIYRGRQLIVAGDVKQLPPTSFWDANSTDGTDGTTWNADNPDEFESVLDLCKSSSAFTSLPLQWHYRSRHEALIAYSNDQFYDGTLATFPGARHDGDDVGIEVFKVDGVYGRGSDTSNPVEASKVAERVLHHRRNNPTLTIGVVAFSAKQQEAIIDAIDELAGHHREIAALRTDDRLHGFFVKNLENVQGDERDLIIFSTGYGPDANGKFSLNLGPVSRKLTGWRRLNVAITRARSRVEIVTSILPSYLERSNDNPSIDALRGYLEFALRGTSAHGESARRPVSELGRHLGQLIESWGFDVDTNVGMSDYRVDLAVRHPDAPGEYVLGVECDAPNYSSSKVTRDRDRLRPEILEGLGWRLHHVWSTAWLSDPTGEERRLRDAIQSASKQRSVARPTAARPAAPVSVVESDLIEGKPDWLKPYFVSSAKVNAASSDIASYHNDEDLTHVLRSVVKAEAPVHTDRIVEAVHAAFGLQKQRQRPAARAAIERKLLALEGRGEFTIDGAIVSLPKLQVTSAREPANGVRRTVGQVPPEELEFAFRTVLAEVGSADQSELLVYLCRLFGWGRLGSEISATLELILERLVESGDAEIIDGIVKSAARP